MDQREVKNRMIMAVLVSLLVFVAVVITAMTLYLRQSSPKARPPMKPLTGQEKTVRDRLKKDVHFLAGTIGERNTQHPVELDKSARWIEAEFRKMGYGIHLQEYEAGGIQVRNIEATLKGKGTEGGVIVLGAHYDSAPGTPGANDNASGVAALLELARMCAGRPGNKTLKLVAFVNEEPPFFKTVLMGSYVYAMEAAENKDRLLGMLSLETIGYYSDEKGSQHFPFPLGFFYPHRGDFLAFVGNFDSKAFLGRCVMGFRASTDLPAEGAAAPEVLPGIGWSDHGSFWRAGYPALMATDTALFRYPHYHQPTDTPEKLDYDRMAKAIMGLRGMIHGLLNE